MPGKAHWICKEGDKRAPPSFPPRDTPCSCAAHEVRRVCACKSFLRTNPHGPTRTHTDLELLDQYGQGVPGVPLTNHDAVVYLWCVPGLPRCQGQARCCTHAVVSLHNNRNNHSKTMHATHAFSGQPEWDSRAHIS